MQVMPVDITAIVAIVMGMSLFLIPVIGLTARFALKPTVEALSRFFEGRGQDESLKIMDRRLALLEQQFDALEGAVRRVEEVAEFDAKLKRGEPSVDPTLPPR
jgi:hypothetical protein